MAKKPDPAVEPGDPAAPTPDAAPPDPAVEPGDPAVPTPDLPPGSSVTRLSAWPKPH